MTKNLRCKRYTDVKPRWGLGIIVRSLTQGAPLAKLGTTLGFGVERLRRSVVLAMLLLCVASAANAQGPREPAKLPPTIPMGLDAFTQWERWPYLRIGVRCY